MKRGQALALSVLMVGVALVGVLYGLLTPNGPASEQAIAPPAVTASVDPSPSPLPSTAAITALRIPAFGIDATVITLGVAGDGTMETPAAPMVVAWYDFSAQPGYMGNAVFAGHVDFAGFGAAVFYRLRELNNGDAIEVTLADGVTYRYKVTSTRSYDEVTAPVAEIVGPTQREAITLITCTGRFDSSTRQYDQRLVVRAERVS